MILEFGKCHYLILSVAPAARNSKLWLWEAINRPVLTVKVRILRSKCLFLRIEVVAIPLHPEVLAVDQDVPVAPAQTAAHAIKLEKPAVI